MTGLAGFGWAGTIVSTAASNTSVFAADCGLPRSVELSGRAVRLAVLGDWSVEERRDHIQ